MTHLCRCGATCSGHPTRPTGGWYDGTMTSVRYKNRELLRRLPPLPEPAPVAEGGKPSWLRRFFAARFFTALAGAIAGPAAGNNPGSGY